MATANPYAPPQMPLQIPRRVDGQATADDAWRSGRLLVVGSKSVLPDRCVKCNAPAAGHRRHMRLAWHSPLLFLGLFLGLLPFVLLAIFLTKRMKVQAGLCPVHIRRRRNVILSASLGVAAGVVIFFTGAVSDAGGGLILVGFVVLMSAILYGIFASRVLKAKKIDKQFAWIKGVCPQYLAELPAFHA